MEARDDSPNGSTRRRVRWPAASAPPSPFSFRTASPGPSPWARPSLTTSPRGSRWSALCTCSNRFPRREEPSGPAGDTSGRCTHPRLGSGCPSVPPSHGWPVSWPSVPRGTAASRPALGACMACRAGGGSGGRCGLASPGPGSAPRSARWGRPGAQGSRGSQLALPGAGSCMSTTSSPVLPTGSPTFLDAPGRASASRWPRPGDICSWGPPSPGIAVFPSPGRCIDSSSVRAGLRWRRSGRLRRRLAGNSGLPPPPSGAQTVWCDSPWASLGAMTGAPPRTRPVVRGGSESSSCPEARGGAAAGSVSVRRAGRPGGSGRPPCPAWGSENGRPRSGASVPGTGPRGATFPAGEGPSEGTR